MSMWLVWSLGLLLCFLHGDAASDSAEPGSGMSYKVVVNNLPSDQARLPPDLASHLPSGDYVPSPGLSVHINHNPHSPSEAAEGTHKYRYPHGYADHTEDSFYPQLTSASVRDPSIVNYPKPEVIYSPVDLPYEERQGDAQAEYTRPRTHTKYGSQTHFQTDYLGHSKQPQHKYQQAKVAVESTLEDPNKVYATPHPDRAYYSEDFKEAIAPDTATITTYSILDEEYGSLDPIETFDAIEQAYPDDFEPEEISIPLAPEKPKTPEVRMYQHQYQRPQYHQPQRRPYVPPRNQHPATKVMYNRKPLSAGLATHHRAPISTGLFVSPIRSPGKMKDCTPVARNIWTYHQECDGIPERRWNTTFPLCGGQYQSPITLSPFDAINKVVNPIVFGTGYLRTTQQVEFVNTGHGLEMIFRDNNDLFVYGGNLQHIYRLIKIVFTSHALHPEDNLRYPLELQLVHAKYDSSYEEALLQKDGVMILSIRVTATNPVPLERLHAAGLRKEPVSRAIQKIIDSLTYMINPAESVKRSSQRQIRVLFLTLSDLLVSFYQGIYVYKGSLPHPPCVQGITWMVLKGAPGIPFQVMDSLTRKLHEMLNVVNLPVTTNYRHTQPRNGRRVELWKAKMMIAGDDYYQYRAIPRP